MSDFTTISSIIKPLKDWPTDTIQDCIVAMAKATLSPIEEDKLIRLLHKRTKVGLKPLRQEFAHARIEQL